MNNTYCSSKYLGRIKTPIIRSNVTNIRVGMSKFRFYTGHRFDKSQIYTNYDANMLETAEHVLLEYKFFDSVRNIFNHKMQNKLALYGLCSNREKLKIILNVHDATNIICSYINQIVVDHAKTLSSTMTDLKI